MAARSGGRGRKPVGTFDPMDDEDPRGDAGSVTSEKYQLERRFGDAAEAAQRIGQRLDLRPSRVNWRAAAHQAANEAQNAADGVGENAVGRLEQAAALIAIALWQVKNGDRIQIEPRDERTLED